MLREIVPDYVKAVNELGISAEAIRLGILLGIYGLGFWGVLLHAAMGFFMNVGLNNK